MRDDLQRPGTVPRGGGAAQLCGVVKTASAGASLPRGRDLLRCMGGRPGRSGAEEAKGSFEVPKMAANRDKSGVHIPFDHEDLALNIPFRGAARIGCAATVLCCFLPGTSWAASSDAEIRAIVDASIRPLMAEHDVPGMAVAVTVNGRAVFLNYGVASRQHGTPVGEETLFELGSLSKLFTGTLASYAQALGSMSLDDHPRQYVPQLKGAPIDKATLLHLGTYTAGGLPLQFPEGVLEHDAILAYFQQWTPAAAPGTVRQYSNPSIGLLGHVTGLAMGTNFTAAMEGRLFPQLGLRHSYIDVPASAMHRYAWGYDSANNAIRVSPGAFAAEAYGVKSTAADMIRFVQANIEPGSLDAPLRRAVQGTHVAFFDVGPMAQGLGWEQYAWPTPLPKLLAGNAHAMVWEPNPVTPRSQGDSAPKVLLFNKTGSTNGFGAYVVFVPDTKIGIVMLANRNYPVPSRVRAAHAILEKLAAGED